MNDKTSHTPGPWKTYMQPGKLVAVCIGKNHSEKVEIHAPTRQGDYKANAALIAAAPDMLAALLTIEHEMGKVISAKAFDEFSEASKTKLQAALLKAIPERSVPGGVGRAIVAAVKGQ